MPRGKLNLKASKKKVEKLLDRIRTREISVDDLMLFHEWAQVTRDYPGGDWCKDFGTFKAEGKGLELSTFLSQHQPCWGQQLE
ncbi:MAG TPA: hypothetical protein VFF64_18280 [Candidatus Eremiobacteraceae bacterium]|nr:hypothetical protein [Candidatus Eremiobacteraceae bacterium]